MSGATAEMLPCRWKTGLAFSQKRPGREDELRESNACAGRRVHTVAPALGFLGVAERIIGRDGLGGNDVELRHVVGKRRGGEQDGNQDGFHGRSLPKVLTKNGPRGARVQGLEIG